MHLRCRLRVRLLRFQQWQMCWACSRPRKRRRMRLWEQSAQQ
ncbi:hypothetical protein SVAN01_10757 [Stagonosporopsis vannaccii]|nr:hypothetical protein SVAN01_10757 [Stagonosporopsis vannaccii]